MTTKLSQWKYT